MSRVAPEDLKAKKVVTGESEPAPEATEPEAPAQPAAADKPFLVYVQDPTVTSADFDKVEKVVLKDERVALGARAFTCVKMNPDDAKADPIVSKQGKEVPRFVLVSADWKNAIAFEGSRLSAGALWDGMRAASDKFYAKSLDAAVKAARDLLTEADKIYAERKTLEDKRSRLDDKATDKDKKEIDDKLAALDARQKALDEKQASIWSMKPKAA